MVSEKDALSRQIAIAMGYDPESFQMARGSSTAASLIHAAAYWLIEGRNLAWDELGLRFPTVKNGKISHDAAYVARDVVQSDGLDNAPFVITPPGTGAKNRSATADAADGSTVNIPGLRRILAAITRASKSQDAYGRQRSANRELLAGGAIATMPLPAPKNYADKYRDSVISEESKQSRAATDERHDRAIHAMAEYIKAHGKVEDLAPWALKTSGKKSDKMFIDLAWFCGNTTVVCEMKAGRSEIDKALGQLERYAAAVFYESEVAESQRLLIRARGTDIRRVLVLDEPNEKNLDAVARYELLHDSIGTPWTARSLILTTSDLSPLRTEGLI